MYIVKATATDRDGNLVSIYVANSNNTELFTLRQRHAKRYDTRDAALVTTASGFGFRVVKLVPRS